MQGICKLCHTDAELQLSHYMGKALYRLCTNGNDKPILVSPGYVKQTQAQIKDYLLCSPCEERFNRNGENYTMTLLNRPEGFKLMDLIRANRPYYTHPETVYRADDIGIDTQPLAYFALSIIWRGSHVWPPKDGFAVGGLNLGVHEERIRRYLLGIGSFPVGAVVKVTAATDMITRGTSDFPRPSPGQADATAFTFITFGLVFDVIIGDPLPEYVYESCCVQSTGKLIFLLADFDKFTSWDYRYCHQNAVIDPKVQRISSS
jgi:hypothetical protein